MKRIGPRATIVRTKTEAELIIPNSELVQNSVYNDTHGDALHRLDTYVGVEYSSDLRKVRSVLESACEGLEWRAKNKDPVVLLAEFGESAVSYRVLVWIEVAWVKGGLLSDLHEAIWWALKDAGIGIAFPQLDVRVKRIDEVSDQG